MKKVLAILSLLLEYTLHFDYQTSEAFRAFESLRNQVDLNLVTNSSSDIEVLGVNWYIEYKEINQKEQNQQQKSNKLEPLMRISAITKDEIFLKKFNKTWFDLDPQNPDNIEIKPVYTTDPHNPFTAYMMENNQTLLTIALKNLTILTFDLNLPVSQTTNQLNPIRQFNAQFRYSEGGETIQSIALIPYSNLVLFSPSRFEAFKVNRLTGEVMHRGRSPLDSTRFISVPVATHRPDRDPHNKARKLDSNLNQRIRKHTEAPHFVMTSPNSGQNALIDWTSMGVVNSFSLKDISKRVKGDDEGVSYYSVRSICYFGGSPRAQMHLMIGSNVIKGIYFFSAINRHFSGFVALPKVSYRGQISWINHTSYVYIMQMDLFGYPGFAFGSFYLNLGHWSHLKPMFSQFGKEWKQDLHFNANLIAFSTDIENNEVFDNFFDKLDYFYLMLYSSGSTVNLEIPNFAWEACNVETVTSDLQVMYYGRFRYCTNSSLQLGFEERPTEERKSKTYIQFKPKKCENGKILHIGVPEYSPIIEDIYKCLDRYELSKDEVNLANDNGCSPMYNLDQNGFCRQCLRMRYKETDIDYIPSDCLLFTLYPSVYQDTLTYNMFHYEYSLLDQKQHYKGFTGEERIYRKLFAVKFGEGSNFKKEFNDYTSFQAQYLIQKSTRPGPIKHCYELMFNAGKTPTYDLHGFMDFRLELIDKDPTGQSVSQKGVYGANSPLNTYYCTKPCPQGFYYDFNSVTCRRCFYGCAECKTYDKCDLCVPGYKMIKRPKYSTHPVQEEMIGEWRVGCQEGFDLTGYNGTCLECDENCDYCMDSVFVLKEKFLEGMSRPSYCLRCHNKSNSEKKSGVGEGNSNGSGGMIVNLTTGVCQEDCKSKLKIGEVVAPLKMNYCYECPKGCLDCEIPDTKNCLTCQSGYNFVADKKACFTLMNTPSFRIYSVVGISVVGVLLLSLCLYVAYRMISGKRKKPSKRNGKSLSHGLQQIKYKKKLNLWYSSSRKGALVDDDLRTTTQVELAQKQDDWLQNQHQGKKEVQKQKINREEKELMKNGELDSSRPPKIQIEEKNFKSENQKSNFGQNQRRDLNSVLKEQDRPKAQKSEIPEINDVRLSQKLICLIHFCSLIKFSAELFKTTDKTLAKVSFRLTIHIQSKFDIRINVKGVKSNSHKDLEKKTNCYH